MHIHIYLQRQIGEYEALTHRTAAVLDLVESKHGTQETLVKDATNILIPHHLHRIARLQGQLAHQLRSRQDLIEHINLYNEKNISRILNRQEQTPTSIADILTSARGNLHTPREAEFTALLITSIANLEAINQINAEIISRDQDDPTTQAYRDVMDTLLEDTRHCQDQRYHYNISPERIELLSLQGLIDKADQAARRSEDLYEVQRTLLRQSLQPFLEQQGPKTANNAMPTRACVRMPMRETSDAEAATLCAGAAVFTNTVRKLATQWLRTGNDLGANAAHLVTEQFAQELEYLLTDRLLPQELDDPSERVPTPELYQSAIKPAAQLDQDTLEIRQRPLGLGVHHNLHDQMVTAAALAGHAAALEWHVRRVQEPRPRQRYQASDHATVSWVHEDTLRRIISDQIHVPPSIRQQWSRGQKALARFDQCNDDMLTIEHHRPAFHCPTVTSILDYPEPIYDPTQDTPMLDFERHQLPHEWTMSYRYQDAHYAKKVGDPYHHDIDRNTARRHAITLLERARDHTLEADPDQEHHLEHIAIIAHELAQAGLHHTPQGTMQETLQLVFRHMPRSTAVHRIIDDLAHHLPAAASYIKSLHHSGSHFLTDQQTKAVVDAARSTGAPEMAINELCHRLQIRPDLQEDMAVAQSFPVPKADAQLVVEAIYNLSISSYHAASTAAQEMGWAVTDLLSLDEDDLPNDLFDNFDDSI